MTGFAIERRLLCSAHQWHTEAPCHDHGTAHAETWFVVTYDGRRCNRASGDYVVYKSYSSAYSYVRARGGLGVSA